MKRVFLLFAFLAMGQLCFSAPPIIDVFKGGGIFGLYYLVTQKYMGKVDSRDKWELNCAGPGFSRCKLNANGGGIIAPPEAVLELMQLEDAMNQLIGEAEDEIENGNHTGTDSKVIALDKDGDGTFDVLVTIIITWENDPDSTEEDCVMQINTNETPY